MGCSNIHSSKRDLSFSTSTLFSSSLSAILASPLRVLWLFPNTRKGTLLPNGIKSRIATSFLDFRQNPTLPCSFPFFNALVIALLLLFQNRKQKWIQGPKARFFEPELLWNHKTMHISCIVEFSASSMNALALVPASELVLGTNPISHLYCSSDKYYDSSTVMNSAHFPMRSRPSISTLITVPTLMA